MKIKKVINNNILCVVDDCGCERIVTGRGIGFGRHRGENLDEGLIERSYRMEDKGAQRGLRELAEKIPAEHLALTQELITDIKAQIPQTLNESLLITLADHISFAIERKKAGMEFSNPLRDSIIAYYPTEYRLGQQCVKAVREKLGIDLHSDEAAFIALHIVNAELNTNMTEMYDITRLIEDVTHLVEYFYGRRFDRDSLDFGRFVVDLRYFAQRLFQDQMLPDQDEEHDLLFRQLIMRNCGDHYKCAQCIGQYVQNTWKKELSQEELTYLTIHLKRINLQGDNGTPPPCGAMGS